MFYLHDHFDYYNKIHYEEIDYFASLELNIDLAFIPVCNFFGQRPNNMTKGAIYSINKLNSQVVIPMHSAGREYLYKEFLNDTIKNNCTNKIVFFESIRQNYE